VEKYFQDGKYRLVLYTDLGIPLLGPYPTLLETFSTVPTTDVWNFFVEYLFILEDKVVLQFQIQFFRISTVEE
jgi:hypothetical protein